MQSFSYESLALKVLIFLLFDLQAALKQATEELQETQRVLAEAKARLAEVEEGIASLQAKYEECIAKKQELEFKTEQCSARLGRAEKVSLIDDIRIPRRPWNERLHSMIARLKREIFLAKTQTNIG